MFPTALETSLALVAGSSLVSSALWRLALSRALRCQRESEAQARQAECEAGHHLCFSTIEALAYAIEAADPYAPGHLDCVQRSLAVMSRALELPEAEAASLRAAALLHNIGRLGVPENILHKPGPLTAEEQEKLRAHPVLAARILASIPFPWDVVNLVRHQAERWDGSGCPDGLQGSAIPLGSRLLAVASAYSAMLRPRPYRLRVYTPEEALAEIEAGAGTQFDPAVVAAFRTVAAQIREETTADAPQEQALTLPDTPASHPTARAALRDITAAGHETRALTALTNALQGTLHLEAIGEATLRAVQELVSPSACALFLPEEGTEFLCAYAARGLNQRYLLGSQARIGTYLTGRSFSRGDLVRANFLPEDLILRNVSDPWMPFRSTLIVPLLCNGQTLGTLNLYHEQPDVFQPEAQRVLRLVATQAGRALEAASRLANLQENATTDALTGLKNARALREFLQHEIARAGREQVTFAVLLLDLDNFKPINDRFGHDVGDQALRDVADMLCTHIRLTDFAARYGGDEFVLILSRADRVAAEVVATKLQFALQRHTQRLQARQPDYPALGASLGIALFPDDGSDLQALLTAADAAMYAVKRTRHAEERPRAA